MWSHNLFSRFIAQRSEMLSRMVWVFRIPISIEHVSEMSPEIGGTSGRAGFIFCRTEDDPDAAGAQEVIGWPIRSSCSSGKLKETVSFILDK